MEVAQHIAVVDDHRDIRDLVGKYLTQQGYRVSVADSTAALKRLLDRSLPDLIVLDIMMPGEDGLPPAGTCAERPTCRSSSLPRWPRRSTASSASRSAPTIT